MDLSKIFPRLPTYLAARAQPWSTSNFRRMLKSCGRPRRSGSVASWAIAAGRRPMSRMSNPVSRQLKVNLRRMPAPERGLADGCESLASSPAHSPLAQIAGRCLP